MHLPCAFGDREFLRSLMARAGLRHPRTNIILGKLRANSADELFEQMVLVTSLAPNLRRLDTEARAGLIVELDEALRPHTDDGRLAIPIETTVALARR
jgi:hypothetical protein